MWRELIAESFRQPRAAARRLLALDPPTAEIWAAGLMVGCLETVVLHVAFRVMPAELSTVFGAEAMAPLVTVVEQLVVLAVAALATARIGALFGGVGTLKGAALVVLWLSFLTAFFPIAAVAVMGLSSVLAGILALASVAWALWAFASFVAELHGFRRLLPVIFGVVATWVIVVFGLSMLFAILGPQEGS
jgi:hypothetical protein